MRCTRRFWIGTLGLALIARRPAFGQTAVTGELVVVKEGTALYHRPGCPVVRDGRGVLALSRGQAEGRGLKPHAECAHDGPAASPRGPAEAPPPPSVTVYVDGPRYYHRHQECTRLRPKSTTVKPLPLEAAAKSHWPCPACKAPILKRNVEPAVPGTGRKGGGSR